MKVEFEATEDVVKILEDLIDKDKYINVAVQLLNEAVQLLNEAVQLLNEAVITERKADPLQSIIGDVKLAETIKGTKAKTSS